MEQLLVHLLADFVFQSDWMAMNKSKRTLPCLVHVVIYTSCFLLLTTSWKALAVIGITHFVIDRWPVILRRLIWLKNHLNPTLTYVPYSKCNITGYYDNMNAEIHGQSKEMWNTTFGMYSARFNYITIWLYIITDNFFHLAINYFAIKYL